MWSDWSELDVVVGVFPLHSHLHLHVLGNRSTEMLMPWTGHSCSSTWTELQKELQSYGVLSLIRSVISSVTGQENGPRFCPGGRRFRGHLGSRCILGFTSNSSQSVTYLCFWQISALLIVKLTLSLFFCHTVLKTSWISSCQNTFKEGAAVPAAHGQRKSKLFKKKKSPKLKKLFSLKKMKQ